MENIVFLRVHNLSDMRPFNWTPTPNSPFVDLDDMERVLGPPYTRNLRIALLTIMILSAFFGNLAVIVLTCGHRMRRTEILFLNLAIADLLVAVFTMTSQLIWECMGREWVAGPIFCRIFKVIQTYSMVASNYLIVAVALDRYWAIVFPLKCRPSIRRLIFGAWLASLVPSMPTAYVFHEHTTPSGKVFCVAKFYTDDLSLLHRQGYMAFILLSVFVMPILVIVVLYSTITSVVWNRPRALSDRLSSAESLASTCVPRENGVHSTHAHYPSAKAKTLRMTAIVVGSFMAVVLPYVVLENISAFGNATKLNKDVVAIIGIFSAANSCINPFVYLILYAKYIRRPSNNNGGDGCCMPVRPRMESSRVVMSTSV